ncbi:hypothetical protein V6N13_017052 [Hibiscus sabdariffa]
MTPSAPNTILAHLTFLADVLQIRLLDGFDSGVCHFSSIGQASDRWGFIGRHSFCKDITATKNGLVRERSRQLDVGECVNGGSSIGLLLGSVMDVGVA